MQNRLMVRESLNKISKMDKANRWLFKTISPYLGKRVLDVGCGNGNIASFLKNKELLITLDNDGQSIDEIKNRLSLFKNLKIIEFDISDARVVRLLRGEKIDTILCINTLEHIENDRAVIASLYDILESEGRLVVLVPALRFLFSSLDNAAGHLRRYNKKEVTYKLSENNFFVEHIAYFNFFGILGWFLQGKIFKKINLSERLLKLFNKLVPLFAAFENRCRIPAGLSLLIVCRKSRESRAQADNLMKYEYPANSS